MVPYLLDLSCERGFFLHKDDRGSEGGSELLFQYHENKSILGTTVLKVVPNL